MDTRFWSWYMDDSDLRHLWTCSKKKNHDLRDIALHGLPNNNLKTQFGFGFAAKFTTWNLKFHSTVFIFFELDGRKQNSRVQDKPSPQTVTRFVILVQSPSTTASNNICWSKASVSNVLFKLNELNSVMLIDVWNVDPTYVSLVMQSRSGGWIVVRVVALGNELKTEFE
jgi:hypothetical protein